jgi:hypothetical protein
MAVICVLAMFAFVFMDPIFGTRRGGGPRDPIAAETKLYGDIHESDLARMRSARAFANQFVQHARGAAFGFAMDNNFFGPDTENAVVAAMILTRKAEQMGMRVTDDDITRFLRDVTDGRVSGDDFAKILQYMSGGRKGQLTRRQLYDALRPELLAYEFGRAFAGNAPTTPAERWESYQKLNNRARIEVIPVAVADFVDKVADPDEKTLQDFFDRYKQFEPAPGSAVPGFKIPAKVALQYFEAEYDQFYDPDAVTEQEIEAEYNKNKDTRYLKRPDFAPAPSGDIDAQSDKPVQPTDEASPGETGETPKEGAASATPATSEPDKTGEAAPEKPGAESPQESPPKQSLDRRGLNGTELALADGVELAQANKKSQTAGQLSAQASEPAPAAKSDETKSDAEAGKSDEPTAEQTAADKADSSAPAAEPATSEKTKTDEAAANPAEKYDPLSKVESDIRKLLAGEKAVERMKTVLTGMRDKMLKYGNDWSRWEARHEHDKTLQPPTPLDFEALAAENHLATHTTTLLSARELADLKGIGEGFVGETPLVNYAFGNWQLYQTATAADDLRNEYLVWKIEQQPARVPELAEVRDEGLRAWKMLEARKPALERAKALADTARNDKLTLGELAARDELQVEKPDPFSWLTYGSMPAMNTRMPPQQSQVKGIEDAGPEFMQTVFSQPDMGIAVAFNNPQTIAYLIQVKEFEPGTEVLRRSFLADDYRTYARVLQNQQQQAYMQWNQTILNEAGLKWLRQPDPRRGQAEGESGG